MRQTLPNDSAAISTLGYSNSSGAPDSPNLDFLRACAVLFVVAAHLLWFFQTIEVGPFSLRGIGDWGVFIFFAHTSLVLTLSLDRQARQWPGQRLLTAFLIRRTFRIFPLSILAVVLVVSLNLPVGDMPHGHFVPAHVSLGGVVSNILLVQNLTHVESVMAPLWSLPYEMQMYLLLPALFLTASAAPSVRPLLAVWGLAFIPALRPWSVEKLGIPDLVVYAPYFVSGVIAYKLMGVARKPIPSALWPVFVAAVTMLYLRDLSTTGGRGPLCCLLLAVAIPRFAQIRQSALVAVSRMIARYSYGIYLTHYVCIWLAFQALHNLSPAAQWITFVLSASLIPVALYYAVEAPMIRLGHRLASRVLSAQRLPQTTSQRRWGLGAGARSRLR
jgi:peptidoglycan/LPS O-acetylase OafA/YrhL